MFLGASFLWDAKSTDSPGTAAGAIVLPLAVRPVGSRPPAEALPGRSSWARHHLANRDRTTGRMRSGSACALLATTTLPLRSNHESPCCPVNSAGQVADQPPRYRRQRSLAAAWLEVWRIFGQLAEPRLARPFAGSCSYSPHLAEPPAVSKPAKLVEQALRLDYFPPEAMARERSLAGRQLSPEMLTRF